jgi:hypothetical protein
MGRVSVFLGSSEAVLAAGAALGCWLSYDSNIGTGNTNFHPWFYTYVAPGANPLLGSSIVFGPALWATSYLSASAACASVLAVALHALGADASRPWLHGAAAASQIVVLALSVAAWAWYIPNLGWLSSLYGFDAAYQYGFWLEVATSAAAALAAVSAVRDASKSCHYREASATRAAATSSTVAGTTIALLAWAVLALTLVALFGSWFKANFPSFTWTAHYFNFMQCSDQDGCNVTTQFNLVAVATQIVATALAFVAALLASAAALSPNNKSTLACYAVVAALYVPVALVPPFYWVTSGRYEPGRGPNGSYEFDYALYCATAAILAALVTVVISGVALCRINKAGPQSELGKGKEMSMPHDSSAGQAVTAV